jgi:CheY-like chemotaxis protein
MEPTRRQTTDLERQLPDVWDVPIRRSPVAGKRGASPVPMRGTYDSEGIEVARRLRETWDVPIIFVTGCTDSETVEVLRSEVPGAPVLPKPIWGDRLTEAVDAVMKFRMS